MYHLILPLLFPSCLSAAQEEIPATTISVDEQVILDADRISKAVQVFVERKETKLKLYASKDGRIKIYSDSRAKEAKKILKLSEAMLIKLDATLGESPPAKGETGELLGLVINKPPTYFDLCDVIARAAESQSAFMRSSKNTTGFTIFAPEITVYYHDASYQEEGRIDHSIAHSLIHLELERPYGELPMWIREGIATAIEDMTTGEVWGPWYRNGFVFSVSHAQWRGIRTRKQVERLRDFERIFSYPANPYDDFFAHEAFAFATYCLLEEPQGLDKMLRGMQELYPETNPKGGRSLLTVEQTNEIFAASFEAGFLQRFQEWWLEPPSWNEKSKKKKRKKK